MIEKIKTLLKNSMDALNSMTYGILSKRNSGVKKEEIIREISRKIDEVQFKINMLSKRQVLFHTEDKQGFSQLTLFTKEIKNILDNQIEGNEAIKKAVKTPKIKSALIASVSERVDRNISGAIDAKLLLTIQEMHLKGESAYLARLEEKNIASRGPLFEHLKQLVAEGKLKEGKEGNKVIYIPAYTALPIPVSEKSEKKEKPAEIEA